MSTNQRIRGRRLQKIRAYQFAQNPLCVRCEEKGIVRMATQSDHVVPFSKDGPEGLDNRQLLCDDCHRIKTAEDMGHRLRNRFDRNGELVET